MKFPVFVFVTVLFHCTTGVSVISQNALGSRIDRFHHPGVSHFKSLLFDIQNYQLVIGARDHLFRLSLEGLKLLEDAAWAPSSDNITACKLKGQSESDCRNYITVLLSHDGRIFACGTSAFAPQCTWRDLMLISDIKEQISGKDKSPHSPWSNVTALMTKSGDYYVATPLDFSARDYAMLRVLGRSALLRTVQYDPKWMSMPQFVASYEIGDFVYFFFREAAVEYMSCGRAVYSRVARVCKNDAGGNYLLRDSWTTFLKARLNCSLPGSYPFYFDHLQSVDYIERDDLFYATFTTGENSIYGTAVCAFNMSAVEAAFRGHLKDQTPPQSRGPLANQHFQCKDDSDNYILDSKKYQLTDQAVEPVFARPFYVGENERFSHIVVDRVPTKNRVLHVVFAVTFEGVIKKIVQNAVNPDESCVVEEIHALNKDGNGDQILSLKFLKDTASLYIGTKTEVLRLQTHNCAQYKTKDICLGSNDPYCGWNEEEKACTSAPQGNPHITYWMQGAIDCTNHVEPQTRGGWSGWSQWKYCEQLHPRGETTRCRCRQRDCEGGTDENPALCEGFRVQVVNCTVHGGWTEWSSWSACSAPCGAGITSRTRTCTNPKPRFGGRECRGAHREEVPCTNNPPCPSAVLEIEPINGGWGRWSNWSECSVPCGGGEQTRYRLCDSPRPQGKGRDCEGNDREIVACNTHICPSEETNEVEDNGVFTAWSPWSECNYRLNEQQRSRECRVKNRRLCDGYATRELRPCLLPLGVASFGTFPNNNSGACNQLVMTTFVFIAFILGVIVTTVLAFVLVRRRNPITVSKHLATPLVQVASNTYEPAAEFKNNFNTLSSIAVPRCELATPPRVKEDNIYCTIQRRELPGLPHHRSNGALSRKESNCSSSMYATFGTLRKDRGPNGTLRKEGAQVKRSNTFRAQLDDENY